MIGRARIAAATVAALAALAVAAPASALPPVPSETEPLLPGGPGAAGRGPIPDLGADGLPAHRPFDRVLGPRGARAAAGVHAADAAQFPTGDGHMVTVRWDAPYDSLDAQAIVTYLAGLLHGPELESLSVFLASPAQMDEICGTEALACYSPNEEEMVISGEPGPEAGLSREFVVAHEYGHHVANNRLNSPFPAIRFGPKYWATQQRVCQGVRSGRYEPYTGYYNNPGEAFAESFAFLHYPGDTDWLWTLPHPSTPSYSAIRRDVLQPWRRGVSGRTRGRLGGSDRGVAYSIRTPLDGVLKLRLKGRPGADLDLYLIARRRLTLLASSTRFGSRERINYLVCGRASARILVWSDHGASAFTLKATRP